jgi:hypothetical protein
LNKDSVNKWFNNYNTVIKKYNIIRGDVWNYNKIGVKLSCIAGGRVRVIILRDLAKQRVS